MTEYFVRWKFGPKSLLNHLNVETSWYQQFHPTKESAVEHYISLLHNSSPAMAMTTEIFKMVQLVPGQEEPEESKLGEVLDKVLKDAFGEEDTPIKEYKPNINGTRNEKILDLWNQGKTRREIADKMGLTYHQVYAVTRPE